MQNVTVTIKADTPNFTLDPNVTAMGLNRYHLIDGNAKYTTELPAPIMSYANADGSITMVWYEIPAGSANIFYFAGTALDGNALDPTSSYLVSASLGARYVNGEACYYREIPPLQAVDQNDNQIEGVTWEFEWHTRFNNDPDWTIFYSNDSFPPLPEIGYTDYLRENVDTQLNPTNHPMQMLVIRQTSAPSRNLFFI